MVIPRGTVYRFRPEGEQRYLTFHTPGVIETPKRYRNRYGQLLEGAPFSHRDIHPAHGAGDQSRARRFRSRREGA